MAAIIDYRGKTPRKTAHGIPLVTAKIVKNGAIEEPQEFIAPEDYQEWMRRGLPEVGDVVLTTEAPLGEVAQLKTDRVALAQRIITLRGFPDLLDNCFLKYLLQSSHFQDQLKAKESGTTVTGIKQSELRKILLPLPPLPEQRCIAHILGTLDDKIEVNRRMNATLEAMARALFRSWFVDFDPVQAKAEGREPAGMDAETAALFPDEFEASELGEIPKGWRVGSLQEIATNPRRGIKPGEANVDTPYIGLEHMPRRSVGVGDWGCAADIQSNKFAFREGEFLFGKLRPYFHKVGIAPIDGVCSTDILVVAPQKDIWSSYVLMTISSDEFVDYTSSASTGTKMPRTSWEMMTGYPIVLPPVDIVSSYEISIHAEIIRITQNIYESRTLAALRDTLLPKLISGEQQAETVKIETANAASMKERGYGG